MKLRICANISKLNVSLTLLVAVVITTFLSHDTIITKVKEYRAKKEIDRAVLIRNIFKVKMKTDIMKMMNPSGPKFALTINGSYLLENKNHCTSVSRLTILVMVLSAPNHFQRRNVIRQTWANGTFYSLYGTIRVLFLLGTINNSRVQGNIEKEFKLYGDIIQGFFIDSSRNLSHKSVMGYKWATERCRNAKYLIKTDDDIVVNMFRVLQSDVAEISVYKYHVHCHRGTGRIERNKGRKLYAESNQFEGMLYYPTFCSGQYVMMLNDMVPYLYEAASKSPYFMIDYVFVYGIVMGNIPSLKYKNINFDEYKTLSIRNFLYFLKQKKTEPPYIFLVTKSVDEMRDIWSAIIKLYS